MITLRYPPAQYTSDLLQALLVAHHIQVSMNDVGNCYDNTPLESFLGRLKAECAPPHSLCAPKRGWSSSSIL